MPKNCKQTLVKCFECQQKLQFHKPSAGAIINTPLHDIIVLLSRRMVRERLQ